MWDPGSRKPKGASRLALSHDLGWSSMYKHTAKKSARVLLPPPDLFWKQGDAVYPPVMPLSYDLPNGPGTQGLRRMPWRPATPPGCANKHTKVAAFPRLLGWYAHRPHRPVTSPQWKRTRQLGIARNKHQVIRPTVLQSPSDALLMENQRSKEDRFRH